MLLESHIIPHSKAEALSNGRQACSYGRFDSALLDLLSINLIEKLARASNWSVHPNPYLRRSWVQGVEYFSCPHYYEHKRTMLQSCTMLHQFFEDIWEIEAHSMT